MITIICQMCNKEAKKQSAQKTCSIECRDKLREAIEFKNKTKVICAFCKKSFLQANVVSERKKKKNHQTFCSRDCMYKEQEKQRAEENISFVVKCAFCSTYMKRVRSQKSFKNNFCSVEHRSMYAEQNRIFKECEACGKEFLITSKKKVKTCCHQHGMWLQSPELLSMRLASEKGHEEFVKEVKKNCSIQDTDDCWIPKWTEKAILP